MTHPEESVAILRSLSRMGVAVSVDDFGTGYSNMSYLRRFPLDKLKIDRSFISDLMTCPEASALVQGIISLAHSLRLKVIAEGVETPEQVELLKHLGCDQLQGFGIAKPLPAADYEHLIRAGERTRRREPSAASATPEVDPEATLSRLVVVPQLVV
jgi:EAL domain-containing protein (putative c-di-GMP-specific phosphodiesterase class I)